MERVRDRLEITFNGHVPSKKNSLRRAMVRGRLLTIPSKQYMAWEKSMLSELRSQVRPMRSPVRIIARYFPGRLQKFDMGNGQESIHDLLVKLGVLTDDNLFELQSFTCELGGLDQGAERVEVEVISYEPTEFDHNLSLLRNADALKSAVRDRKEAGQKITQKALKETLWSLVKRRGAIA